MDKEDFKNILYKIVYIDYNHLNEDELIVFLRKYLDDYPKCIYDKGKEGAEIRRLIRIYDYMKYK